MIHVGDIIEFHGSSGSTSQLRHIYSGSVCLVSSTDGTEIYDVLSSDGVIDSWAFSKGLNITIYPLADPNAPLVKLSWPQKCFVLQLLGCEVPSSDDSIKDTCQT